MMYNGLSGETPVRVSGNLLWKKEDYELRAHDPFLLQPFSGTPHTSNQK